MRPRLRGSGWKSSFPARGGKGYARQAGDALSRNGENFLKPANISPGARAGAGRLSLPTFAAKWASPGRVREAVERRGAERSWKRKGPAEAGPFALISRLRVASFCYRLCSVVTVFSKRSLCCAVKLFEKRRT